MLGGFERIILSDLFKFNKDVNNQNYPPAFQGNINNYSGYIF